MPSQQGADAAASNLGGCGRDPEERTGARPGVRDHGRGWPTHGGFYAHLRSKDDVVAQAIGRMFDAAYANLLARTESRARGLHRQLLAPSHCVDLANGCPIAAPSGALHHAGRGSAMSHA